MNNQMIRTTRLTDGQIIDLLVAIRDADDIGFEQVSLSYRKERQGCVGRYSA